jgi:hypothetical protein
MSSIVLLSVLVLLCASAFSQAAVAHSRRDWTERKVWGSVWRQATGGDSDSNNQGALIGSNKAGSWQGDSGINQDDASNTGSGWTASNSNSGWNANSGSSGWTETSGSNGWTGTTGGSGWTGTNGDSGWTGNTGGSGWTGNNGGSGWTGNNGGRGWTGNNGGSELNGDSDWNNQGVPAAQSTVRKSFTRIETVKIQ